MRIGKSGAFVCDFCANVITGEADELKQAEGVNHFCRSENCLAEYLIEVAFADVIRERVSTLVKDEVGNFTSDKMEVEVQKRMYRELNQMDKITCKKCKDRYKAQFVRYY